MVVYIKKVIMKPPTQKKKKKKKKKQVRMVNIPENNIERQVFFAGCRLKCFAYSS